MLMDALATNPMFTAGAGLVGIGTALAVLKHSATRAAFLVRRRYITSLEITSYDKSYLWLLQWIQQRMVVPSNTAAELSVGGKSGGVVQSMMNRWQQCRQLSLHTSYVQHDNGSISTQFRFVPGPGRHIFCWNNIWFQVERQREKQTMMAANHALPQETLTLHALTPNPAILHSILQDAKRLALTEEEGKTVVYTSWGQEWRPFGYPRRRRPLGSVVLDKGLAELIVRDVKGFLDNGEWYINRGIPYRRGYLLYGPPGSGKSSFIQALAGELEYNVCVMNLSEKYLSDDRLNLLLSSVPQRSIILLEDIDAAFLKTRDKQSDSNSITFSGFLNALDGLVSSEGRIIFMTTNHLERLDPALLRPGRIDLKLLIDNASPYQIETMFLRFYEGRRDLAKEFVEGLDGWRVSTAQLQGHFVFFKESAEEALKNIGLLREHAAVVSVGDQQGEEKEEIREQVVVK